MAGKQRDPRKVLGALGMWPPSWWRAACSARLKCGPPWAQVPFPTKQESEVSLLGPGFLQSLREGEMFACLA